MTESELAAVMRGIAPVIQEMVAKATTEANTKVAVLEAKLLAMGEIKDRVLTLELKTAPAPSVLVSSEPEPALVDLRARVALLEPLPARLHATELAMEALKAEGAGYAGVPLSLANVRERVAALEATPLQPGPTGEPGPPGKDGVNGKAGATYQGVYQDGKGYDIGDMTTWGGSVWHCNEPTDTKPGDGSKAWTLMVKRGRDGKDGLNGKDYVPVVKVGV